MPTKERLIRILEEKYGITSPSELEEAIRCQRKIDISVFVSNGKDGELNE